MSKIQVGDIFPFESLENVKGDIISLRNGAGLIHIHLARFSGCPACNLNFKRYADRSAEFQKAGIRNVMVLHSEKKTIVENQGDKFGWMDKLDFVADPKRVTYKKVGAEMQLSALCTSGLLVLMLQCLPCVFAVKDEGVGEGRTQRPVNLLLDAKTGQVVEKLYGARFDDCWTVAQVMELASKHKKNE